MKKRPRRSAPGMHGSTFGGSALACRVALEFFDILDELLPSIRRVGDYFRGAPAETGAQVLRSSAKCADAA